MRSVVSVRLFSHYLLNRLTFDLIFECAWVITIARRRLKVKVIRSYSLCHAAEAELGYSPAAMCS